MPKIKIPRKIRELVKKANAGSGDAAWDLYVHYHSGTGGVEENHELARHWLESGAELGDADAQCNLGCSHKRAGDYGPAREWFLKAAAQGSQTGEYNLGRLYEQGLGVEQNKSTAAEFYHRAALKGHARAQHKYGYFLDTERNDYEGAMKWYQKAAAQGDVQAEYNIGAMYLEGQGVERDVAKAREWFERAAAHGDEDAQEQLREWDTLTTTRTEFWVDAFSSLYMFTEKRLVVLAATGDAQAISSLKQFREVKRNSLLYVLELSGLNLSDDVVEHFISGPLADHDALNPSHHIGLCFLHGRCGLEKNLRMAKDTFKASVIEFPDNPAVEEELVKLRACVTCGKTDVRWGCKLCRGVRYCDKRCQQRDWNRGDPPHKETCARVVHMFPPGFFAALREKVAKKNEEASA